MKQKKTDEPQWTILKDLPEKLKPFAISKAQKIGYEGKEIERLYFKFKDGQLLDGCLDKNLSF